jgi:hypothetical protein
MIQRIQSLYLLGVALLQLLMFYFPIWEGAVTEGGNNTQSVVVMVHKTIVADGGAQTANTTLMILNSVLALGAFACIFLYKRRMLQLKLSRLLVLICCGLIGLMFYTVEQAKPLLAGVTYTSNYEVGTYLPLASLMLLFLAGQSILKDERLVRSAERLR